MGDLQKSCVECGSSIPRAARLCPISLIELSGHLPARRDDQRGFRGIDNQPSGELEIHQEATNALDATRGAPAFANPDQGAE